MHSGFRRVFPAAILTLVGGFVLGFFVGRGQAISPLSPLPEDLSSWEIAVTKTLALTEIQARDLRVVLHRYEKERRGLLDAGRSLLEPELAALDARFEALIRTRVLNSSQRRKAFSLDRARQVVRPSTPR